ncbi:MAG: extradiol dioxygenase, partial [Thermoleophilia bacterium]|nr:extradiol dioxygenase [Thermoleophilia bacterium]
SHDFRDPWGNHWQVVDYRDIQFTKASRILEGMGLGGLEKSERAFAELRAKGLAD